MDNAGKQSPYLQGRYLLCLLQAAMSGDIILVARVDRISLTEKRNRRRQKA